MVSVFVDTSRLLKTATTPTVDALLSRPAPDIPIQCISPMTSRANLISSLRPGCRRRMLDPASFPCPQHCICLLFMCKYGVRSIADAKQTKPNNALVSESSRSTPPFPLVTPSRPSQGGTSRLPVDGNDGANT